MTRRSKIWRVVAALFTVGNLAGAAYAAVLGEGLHAGAHIALMLLGACVVWRLSPRSETQASESDLPIDDRMEQLQQSVDAVAIEVERIGEAQRFSARLQAERAETRR
ncbi:MAG: hypothetical protein ABIV10_12650 [Gemmatimonadaceae bacterium]